MGSRVTYSIRDYDRPADRIRQHRQADKRPVVVVEGSSDARLIREGFKRRLQPFPVGTRSVALETIRQLVDWKFASVVCIVDRDFDRVVATHEADGLPLHPYENADIEAMLSLTDALRLMLIEVGSEQKLTSFGGMPAVLKLLHSVVMPVTRLRAANAEMGWGLAFDEVDLADKVDMRTLSLKVESYCAALASKSPNAPRKEILVSWANGTRQPSFIPTCPRGSSPYFRGRDFLAIVGVALRSKIGSCERAATRSDHLARVLRAVSGPMLSSSKWGDDLLAVVGLSPGTSIPA